MHSHRRAMAERPGFEPGQRLPVDRLAICSITTLAPLHYYYELLLDHSRLLTRKKQAYPSGCKCNFSIAISQTKI